MRISKKRALVEYTFSIPKKSIPLLTHFGHIVEKGENEIRVLMLLL